MSASPVQRCAEWHRIDALPRREVVITDEIVDRVTAMFLRPGAVGRLREIQVLALLEAIARGGLLGPIRAGAGKTLITFLLPVAVGAVRPVLLVPAKLREKTLREYVESSRTWRVHPRLTVDSYEMQSRADHAQRLADHDPDWLICDECHRLKSDKPAITRRVARLINADREGNPRMTPVRTVMLSGTLIRGSLRDAAHLGAWSLGDGSPFPRAYGAIETWSAVMDQRRDDNEDVSDEGGALLAWAKGSTVGDVRRGFRDRVAATPGVIATHDVGPDVALALHPWRPPVPSEIADAMTRLADMWRLPDGRDLEDPLRFAAAMNELALGFWYRWRVIPPDRWLHTRRLWAWYVRSVIAEGALDSVEQVARACRAGELCAPTVADVIADRAPREGDPLVWDVDLDASIADAWATVRPTFEPETEPVWVSDEIAHAAADWARANTGIVWCRHATFGRRLDALGVPYYGAGGLRGDVPIEAATGPIAASIKANSEGRNLQHAWSRMLIPGMSRGPASAAEIEQTIARVHRDGQTADTVGVWIMLAHEHQREAFASTLRGARFLEQTTGQPQRLTIAINATGAGT